jgi:hypothetical protein
MLPRALIVFVCVFVCAGIGCTKTASIHVWQPAEVPMPPHAKIALAPLGGDRELADRVEQQLLAQRRSDLAVFTAEQLAQASPIRLASTASLSSDLTAIQAARAAGADVLLVGEILQSQVDLQSGNEPARESENMNLAFFQRRENDSHENESILLSWRVLDVESAHTMAAHSFTLHSREARKLYPDLVVTEHDSTQVLIAATARETWKSVAPYVTQDRVRLAVPWFAPGAFTVQRGVAAARKGQWPLAEQRWSRVSSVFWFNSAAHHNLAIAKAAREDFPAAKEELQKARGLFAYRLPSNTLYWLDQRHRLYNEAHGLGEPEEGWAFLDLETGDSVETVAPVEVAELPWWTAIPFAKPPGWTWRGWLTQPVVF